MSSVLFVWSTISKIINYSNSLFIESFFSVCMYVCVVFVGVGDEVNVTNFFL